MGRLHHQSWGRYPRARQTVRFVDWISGALPFHAEDTALLPYGLGRSYGDCCLNDEGILLDTTRLNRFISFDAENGILRCESGVSLADILELVVPKGWFLPVTPGTKFVTVGGAIANDIHGKNHHRAGTFGNHTLRFELARSSGQRIPCSPVENAEWFNATIGGIGLTGLITWAEIRLKRIRTASLDVETIRFDNVAEFLSLSAESDRNFEYTVAWVDCFSGGDSLGRGLFMRANHADTGQAVSLHPGRPGRNGRLTIPFDAPDILLNDPLMKVFNGLYYRRQRGKRSRNILSYEPFFYPLDVLGQWNRLYGKHGFFQYQCVVPYEGHREAACSILKTVAHSSPGVYLAVLKLFGDAQSPGMLSFPRPGLTFALDIPNRGQASFALMDRLDAIVRQAGGAVYPAKDARMSPESFDAYFPRWRDFEPCVDPKFSSSFWRRVTEGHRGAE
jgi:FAD/FMN-containing dehydrogenase